MASAEPGDLPTGQPAWITQRNTRTDVRPACQINADDVVVYCATFSITLQRGVFSPRIGSADRSGTCCSIMSDGSDRRAMNSEGKRAGYSAKSGVHRLNVRTLEGPIKYFVYFRCVCVNTWLKSALTTIWET